MENDERIAIETEDQPMLKDHEDYAIIINDNNNNVQKFPNYSEQTPEKTTEKTITLFWLNMTYTVKEKVSKNISGFVYRRANKSKNLIENLSGSIVSGKLTAILGPNGAGKTTLLECLAGKRKSGLSGRIMTTYMGVKPNLKFSYYSQKDILIDLLSVEESLLYAYQLKYCRKNHTFDDLEWGSNGSSNGVLPQKHFVSNVAKRQANEEFFRRKIEKTINDLHLEKCSKTPVCHCSGGQRRRLSIALELIFSPSILLLDEPTSGLDSLSTLQCIQLLKRMSKRAEPMIIAVVIHQPTARLLSYFDNLYVMSSTGQCIYEGPTCALIDHLKRFDLHCPQFHNPSDFAIEIASGDYGCDAIEVLANHQKSLYKDFLIDSEKSTDMSKVIRNTQTHSLVEQMKTTWVLTKRCALINLRDPKQYLLQLSSVVFMLGLLIILHINYKIGTNDGCLKKPTPEYLRSLHIFDVLNPDTSPFPNWAFVFYSLMFVVFISMLPNLLTFPLEVSIFTKEHSNGWYSLCSFYLARNIADIPPIIIFPVMYGIASYIITEQLLEFWRICAYIGVTILLAFLTQGMGFLVSVVFINNITAATVIGAIINIPLILFAGLLIKLQTIPLFFRPFTYISYFRLTYECLMTIIYGFGRCAPVERITVKSLLNDFGDQMVPLFKCIDDYDTELVDNVTSAMDYFNGLVDKSHSFALQVFDYNESHLWANLLMMVGYALAIRILAFIILAWKVKFK